MTKLFPNRWIIVLVLFTARGAAAGFFQTVYVYTPEVYPTKLRALAMGERGRINKTLDLATTN